MDRLTPNSNLSHYRIVSKLGAGGMGEVYLAFDTELDRTVAIKILPESLASDQQRLQRFIQEAKAASALNHPHILTIHEIDAAENTRFIATEFIDGETLRKHTKSALKLTDILEIAIQAASALAAAHSAGIIHRDVKPENIMVRRDGYIKVLDFGLAKLTEPQDSSTDTEAPTKAMVNTGAGVVMGTPNYMSPEQAKGVHVDTRSDIWSLGVVLYEMVAAHLPFPGETPTETISLILQKDAPPLTRFAPTVPTELERIVTKALSKDREERYQTMKDLLLDLRALKRKIEVDAEIDRTVSPESRSASSTSSGQSPTATGSGATATAQARVSQASSAEYVVSGIRKHKKAVVAVAALLLIGAVVGFYLRARTTTVPIKSIAVMPFVNEGGKAELEYLSDGMTDTLISSLSQLPNLSVKARSSVFRYKGKETTPQTIARDLNVQAILNGRIAQRADQLTLTVELVDAQTENVIWSEQYNRHQADIVSLQSEIARDVSNKLRTKLSGVDAQKVAKTFTANPEAYQLYLKGLYHWNKRTAEALKTSIDYFNQAIEKDPSYAQSYAGVALAYVLLPQYSAGKPEESMAKAKAAARKALELDDTLAEAHTALGQALFTYDRNVTESDRQYQRAIELNPNYATAHQWYGGANLVATGRFDEAIAEGRRAVELDPLSLIANLELAAIYHYARQNDQAIAQLRKITEMDPNWYLAHMVLCQSYSFKGQFVEAIAECEKARDLDDDPAVLSYLARAYVLSGKRAEALKVVGQMHELARQRYVPAYGFGFVYAALGDKDQAFQWLERSLQDRAWEITYVKVDPVMDSLRSDPRFNELVKRVGL